MKQIENAHTHAFRVCVLIYSTKSYTFSRELSCFPQYCILYIYKYCIYNVAVDAALVIQHNNNNDILSHVAVCTMRRFELNTACFFENMKLN